MAKLDEIMRLAEKATKMVYGEVDASEWYRAYLQALNPQTVRQMVELIRMQHEAIARFIRKQQPMDGHYFYDAIDAFEKFEKGE